MWSTAVAGYSKIPPCFTSFKYTAPMGLGQGFGIMLFNGIFKIQVFFPRIYWIGQNSLAWMMNMNIKHSLALILPWD